MSKKFFAAIALAMALAPMAAADPLTVKVDQTVPLKLNAPANSVVVGNATVADVSVHDAKTLLVTGKAFGSTNLTVLDRSGNTIFSTMLVVGALAWWLVSHLITLLAYILVIALVVGGAAFLVSKARRSIGGGRRRIGR